MTDKPFLERWAGRKAAARTAPAATEADSPAPPGDEAVGGPGKPPAPPPAAPITEEELAALPPIESLGPGSSIRDFLRPGVPSALKNAAMRRMWLATPAIRDHKDIAVDYAWDWNTPGGVPGDGGPLDPEKVAKWARQIAGLEERPPKTPRSAPSRADAAAPAPAPGKAETGAEIAEKGTQAAQHDTPEPRQGTGSEPPSTRSPRPRHGGARPQ